MAIKTNLVSIVDMLKLEDGYKYYLVNFSEVSFIFECKSN